jgi:hypothetical protein
MRIAVGSREETLSVFLLNCKMGIFADCILMPDNAFLQKAAFAAAGKAAAALTNRKQIKDYSGRIV